MAYCEAPGSVWHPLFDLHLLPHLLQLRDHDIAPIKLAFAFFLRVLMVDLILSDGSLEATLVHLEAAVLVRLELLGNADGVAHIVQCFTCVNVGFSWGRPNFNERAVRYDEEPH